MSTTEKFVEEHVELGRKRMLEGLQFNDGPLRARIKLLGSEEVICDVHDIKFGEDGIREVSVWYPVGKRGDRQLLTYHFDGRKYGEDGSVDLDEIFLGFTI